MDAALQKLHMEAQIPQQTAILTAEGSVLVLAEQGIGKTILWWRIGVICP